MNTELDAISIAESKRFSELETNIEAGKKTFIAVGLALMEIRDSRLYRSDYTTFENYCRERWNFTRQYVNTIISGVVAVKALPVEMETIVSNPGQAAALAKVAPARRAEVLQKAVDAGPVTAKSIQQAAEPEVIPPATPPDKSAEFLAACGVKNPAEAIQELKYNLEMAREDIGCILRKIEDSDWDAEAIGQAALELRVTAGKLEKLKKQIQMREAA